MKVELSLLLFLKSIGSIIHGEDVANDYHVTDFPTINLIDKNVKIIYTDLGYNKDLEKTIELLLL